MAVEKTTEKNLHLWNFCAIPSPPSSINQSDTPGGRRNPKEDTNAQEGNGDKKEIFAARREEKEAVCANCFRKAMGAAGK
ncbi:hypothetical protein [Microbulbifer sp. HZ11]|uniref:hypothetical protein n=1 Tax=unclassified Microbulbifer TaxID=2619833 RepID=UPI0012DDFCE6|nr:hypothetical protein [Microbulbifer sp. HZ11]